MQKKILKGIAIFVGMGIWEYLFSFPFRFVENWAMGYFTDKLLESWHDVLSFVIIWVVPFLLAIGLIFLGYWLRSKRISEPLNNKPQIPREPKTENTVLPSRREALESAKVAWGCWHTGTRMRIERLLKLESLKRILILEPNMNNESVGVIAQRSGEPKEGIITQLRDTTRESMDNTKDIRWYTNHRESAFTIYDPTPIQDVDGVLKPYSDNAWLYVEYLNPGVGVDQRPGEIIFNKGEDKSRFMGFYREYENIWDKESIMAKDIKEEKPTVIKDTEVKLNAKDTEKAVGMEVTTPTELNNVRVNVTAENVKEATGFRSVQTNKPIGIIGATIVCSCGKAFPFAATGHHPKVILCPHCGKELKNL